MSIHYYIRKHEFTTARKLVEEFNKFNEIDDEQRTPLMICSLEDDEKWALGVAMMLLQAGADTTTKDKENRDVLMYASLFCREDLFHLLLRAVTHDLDRQDAYGNTALHYAILTEFYSVVPKLLRIMISRGASTKVRNMFGNTPQNLVKNRKVFDFLEPMFAEDESFTSTKITRTSRHFPRHTAKYGENPNELRTQVLKSVRESVRYSGPTSHKRYRSRSCRGPTTVKLLERTGKKKKKAATTTTTTHITTTKNDDGRPKTAGVDVPVDCAQTWRGALINIQDLLVEQISPSYRPSARPIVIEEDDSDSVDSDCIDDFPNMRPMRQRAKSLYPGMISSDLGGGKKVRGGGRRESVQIGMMKRNNRRESEVSASDLSSLINFRGNKARNKRRESVDPSMLRSKGSLLKGRRRDSSFIGIGQDDQRRLGGDPISPKPEQQDDDVSKLSDNIRQRARDNNKNGLDVKPRSTLNSLLEAIDEDADSDASEHDDMREKEKLTFVPHQLAAVA